MLEYINIHSDLERLQCWLALITLINLKLFIQTDESRLSEEKLLEKANAKQLIRSLKKYLRGLKKKNSFQEPIIKVYYVALKFLLSWRMSKAEKAEKYFTKLRSYIFNAEEAFPRRHLRQILLVANNFCAIKIGSLEFRYATFLWQQYQYMLDKNLLFAGNYIKTKEFKNIVTIGLMSDAIAETEQFIKKNIKKVPSKVRKYVEAFNRANLCFHKKEYEKAEAHLRKITRRTAKIDVSYVLGLRVLELKLYFEWENHKCDDEFEKRAKAFESLLKKGAISTRSTKSYLAFIENIQTLFAIKNNHFLLKRHEKRETLNNLLEKNKNPKAFVIERKWLIESINVLY
jgi:hypothetical protein